MPDKSLVATCQDCGTQVELHPPDLPANGGAASFHDDPVAGWQILEFVCGSCWDKQPKPLSTRYYSSDPYQLAKEAYWCQREF
ncbi:MAG: hypothetical protein JRM86_03145, partial [Nitrososphaerota archaeon]|nr:hypothetical protein [Nitrososphaerota archaeon]